MGGFVSVGDEDVVFEAVVGEDLLHNGDDARVGVAEEVVDEVGFVCAECDEFGGDVEDSGWLGVEGKSACVGHNSHQEVGCDFWCDEMLSTCFDDEFVESEAVGICMGIFEVSCCVKIIFDVVVDDENIFFEAIKIWLAIFVDVACAVSWRKIDSDPQVVRDRGIEVWCDFLDA